ncbi:MAG: DUF11 domain-containing protein [Acidobacteria bacterium]|nr:DUF11 domain-containing protein [Acidobacteriota bacterium]
MRKAFLALACLVLFPASEVRGQGNLTVTKSDSGPVIAGNDVTYTISVVLGGALAVPYTVSVTDTVPTNTTFVSFTAPGGWSSTTPAAGGTGTVTSTTTQTGQGLTATFTLVVNVNPSTPATTTLSNTANASCVGAPGCLAGSGTDNGPVVSTNADLNVTKGGPATITAGNDIAYSVTITNDGPSDAQSATLSDTLPAGTTFVSETQTSGPTFNCTNPPVGAGGTVSCTIATLAAGATADFTLVFHVNANVADGVTITNTASVASPTTDPTPGNNDAPTSAAVGTAADLVVTKTGPPTAAADGNITYNVTVSNNGPSDAQNVTLSDTSPAGTTFVSETQNSGPAFNCTNPAVGAGGTVSCVIATLAAGATSEFTLVFHVDAGVAAGTTITNTAVVSASTTDPTPGNNSASASAFGGTLIVPAVSPLGLLLLVLTLTIIGVIRLRS